MNAFKLQRLSHNMSHSLIELGVGITRGLTIRYHHDTYVTLRYCCDFKYIAIFCYLSQFITFFPTSNFSQFQNMSPKRKLSTSVLSKKIHFSVCSSHFNFVATKWGCQADKLTNTYIIIGRYLASVYRYGISTENIAMLCCIDFFPKP